jgi:mono/diheme cytochrome c family protein
MFRTVIRLAILSIAGAASAAPADAKAQGEKVYADQKCALCHSIGAKGNAKGPLDEVGSKLSADDIRAWIADAKGMTASRLLRALRKSPHA